MSKTREFDTGRLLALREEQGFIATIIINHQMLHFYWNELHLCLGWQRSMDDSIFSESCTKRRILEAVLLIKNDQR